MKKMKRGLRRKISPFGLSAAVLAAASLAQAGPVVVPASRLQVRCSRSAIPALPT